MTGSNARINHKERIYIASTPKRSTSSESSQRTSQGTTVRTKSYNILAESGYPDLARAFRFQGIPTPEHMFVEYDDGNDKIIARGGPSAQGGGFVRDYVGGNLRVRAEVKPEAQSADRGKRARVVSEVFMPGVTASQAAKFAEAEAKKVNGADNLYGPLINSNSFVGNLTEGQLGHRVGSPGDTWGWRTQLGDAKFSPDMEQSRKVLGSGFGSTPLGQAVTKSLEFLGRRDPKMIIPQY